MLERNFSVGCCQAEWVKQSNKTPFHFCPTMEECGLRETMLLQQENRETTLPRPQALCSPGSAQLVQGGKGRGLEGAPTPEASPD